MKNILLVILVSLWCLQNANAQNLNIESAGAKAGINTFMLTGDDIGGTKTLLGIHFGGYANLGISEQFSINPELLYSLYRWRDNDSDNLNASWSYVDLPILMMINADQVLDGLTFHAGPQIGFLLKAKVKGTSSRGTEVDADNSDLVKNTNFGFALGAGYELPLGLILSIRYVLGLSQAAEETADFQDPDVKTRSFQLSASYPLFNK